MKILSIIIFVIFGLFMILGMFSGLINNVPGSQTAPVTTK